MVFDGEVAQDSGYWDQGKCHPIGCENLKKDEYCSILIGNTLKGSTRKLGYRFDIFNIPK